MNSSPFLTAPGSTSRWVGRSWILAALIGLFLPSLALAGPWIWFEAERWNSSNTPASTWLSPGDRTERGRLSNGNVLTVTDIKTNGPYWATYNVNVLQAGTYRFYTRKIWQYGAFKWRFDSEAWLYASYDLPFLDSSEYKDNFPLNWVYLGDVTLTAAVHSFRLELDVADWPNDPRYAGGADLGGFDAFLLSSDPFVARGRLKPGDKYNLAEPGKWSFEPGLDDYSSSALLDLRSLNEAVAGQSGYVRRADHDPGKFVLGDGSPVRFWGVNVSGLDLGSLSAQAKFLAKRGVNLVRLMGPLSASDPADINAVDAGFVDAARRAVAAFKGQGIYTELDFYWAATITIRKEWGVDGYTSDQTTPWAVLMLDEKLKAAYKQWVTQLLAPTNAHTGIPLALDPAVAIIELQNEDGLLWWSFDPSTTGSLPEVQRQKLESQFGTYLIKEYGSIAAAQAGWLGVTLPGDSPASGRMGLASPWYLTAALTDGWFLAYTPRMADQIAFLADLQRAFYREMGGFLRDTLGCSSLIASGNWRTADELFLLDVERYTYTANDVIDHHPYFDPVHVDPNPPDTSSYMVSVGDYYQSVAVVSNPRRLPAAYKQVAGYPHIASEVTWVNPTRFKAEGPMLVAAYNSMADIDGWLWFGAWYIGYEDTLSKFQAAVPSLMGQFPGAALLYRRGDVETAVAVREARNLNRAHRKEPGLISEYNPGRRPADTPAYDPATGTGRLDPLAMLVGQASCDYLTEDGPNYVAPDLLSHIDMDGQIVESLPIAAAPHGQLILDWGKGIFQVNSDRSQGICGFLNHVPSVELGDVTIASSNEFGAILVISLDDLPIVRSQKILIQAMTEDAPYHWEEEDQVFTSNDEVYHGKRIVSLGQAPFNVVNIAGTVTLKGLGEGRTFRAMVLDENGYARGDGVSAVIGADLQVTLPADSLYTVLVERSAPRFTGCVVNAGGRITLTWAAVVGQRYQLEWTADLREGNWSPSGAPIVAGDLTATTSDVFGNDRLRIYRLVVLP